MTSIAFQGERAAYSEIAAKKLFGNNITISPSFSFEEVFLKVKEKKVNYGVVPIENSLYGSVFETYDLLLQNSLSIISELNLQINHCLLASKNYKFNEIKKVYSHPQALGQCSVFLKSLKNAQIIPAYDTAGSALISLKRISNPNCSGGKQKCIGIIRLENIKK